MLTGPQPKHIIYTFTTTVTPRWNTNIPATSFKYKHKRAINSNKSPDFII